MLIVTQAVERFLASLRSRCTPFNTVKSYASDLHSFVRSVSDDLATVDPPVIQAFLDGGALSPATRRRRHAALSTFYRWLMRQENLQTSPMERVEAVRVSLRQPRPMPCEVAEAIISVIPTDATRDRTLFTLLYETGMRVGEAIGLQHTDVDLAHDDEKVRVIGKGGRERTILLAAAPESIRLLRRHLKATGINSGSIFRGDSRYGGSSMPVRYATVLRAWQKYCKKANVQATIHQLRHTRASELVRNGVPLGTVRKLLGHRHIQSTMLYAETDLATMKRDLLDYQRKIRLSR